MAIFIATLFATTLFIAGAASGAGAVKSAVFHSPPFYLLPGSVVDKYYYDIPFPKGHILLKSFQAEVVDEAGTAVPLHEAYLHHWIVVRYYGRIGAREPVESSYSLLRSPDRIIHRNSGTCPKDLGQIFGLGSETRRTKTWIPDPYGIAAGDPAEPPEGFEERWLLNVHAIDTRSAVDRLGCTECRCQLYNVTVDVYGRPLKPNYIGGLKCCYEGTRCMVSEEAEERVRKLFLKYIVEWVDWEEGLVPVMVYIIDITDTVEKNRRFCRVEYDVDRCGDSAITEDECVDVRKTKVPIPSGGDVIYGVVHQHSGGSGGVIYGQDGRLLCESKPIYGRGKKAGDEEGYIVGMSTCYPTPGSVRVSDGELVTVTMNYNSTEMHTGVMGLFYLLVAQPTHEYLHTSFPSSRSDESA